MNKILLVSFAAFSSLFSGCVTLFDKTTSLSNLSAETSEDPALTAFYQKREALIDQRFMAPVWHGNIVTWFSPDKAKFADNTVYLGNVIAWRALSTGGPNPSKAFMEIAAIVRHVSQELSPPTTLPDGTANQGYFNRDDVMETSAVLDGKTYVVKSDAQTDGNEMSQDQLVHLLFGYSVARDAARMYPSLTSAREVLNLIAAHAHQIGMRLKAYNYIVTNPEGKAVRRGPDARGFAWPIARTISILTGNDIRDYLGKVEIDGPGGKPVKLDQSGAREIFYSALDGLSTGICDLTVGTDSRYLCNRFTLRMINSIYFASRSYWAKPLYIQRMDADGDYLGALSARMARGDKAPKKYVKELKSAVGTDIASTTAPGLWCRESRWIFMPESCPEEDDGTLYHYNGVDFLTFYAALRWGAPIFKIH